MSRSRQLFVCYIYLSRSVIAEVSLYSGAAVADKRSVYPSESRHLFAGLAKKPADERWMEMRDRRGAIN